jgi:hypothetical protein
MHYVDHFYYGLFPLTLHVFRNLVPKHVDHFYYGLFPLTLQVFRNLVP